MMEEILKNFECGIKDGIVASQRNKVVRIEKNTILQKMESIENDIPLTSVFQKDAQEQWTIRWIRLKCWLTMYDEA